MASSMRSAPSTIASPSAAHRRAPHDPAAGAGRADRSWLVRRARCPARLASRSGPGQGQRARLGRRLCRTRRHRDQPGRAYARRSGPRPRNSAHRTAVGWAPLAQTGSPSRCAGSACVGSTSPTSWLTGTRRADVPGPRRSHASPTSSPASRTESWHGFPVPDAPISVKGLSSVDELDVEPVAVVGGQGVVAGEPAFESRDLGGPEAEVVGGGGEGDVAGLAGGA